VVFVEDRTMLVGSNTVLVTEYNKKAYS